MERKRERDVRLRNGHAATADSSAAAAAAAEVCGADGAKEAGQEVDGGFEAGLILYIIRSVCVCREDIRRL